MSIQPSALGTFRNDRVKISQQDTKMTTKIRDIKQGTHTTFGKVMSYINVFKMISSVCSSIKKCMFQQTSELKKTAKVNIARVRTTVQTEKSITDQVGERIKTGSKMVKELLMPIESRSISSNYSGREACRNVRTIKFNKNIKELSQNSNPTKEKSIKQQCKRMICEKTFGGTTEELGNLENIDLLQNKDPQFLKSLDIIEHDILGDKAIDSILNQCNDKSMDILLLREKRNQVKAQSVADPAAFKQELKTLSTQLMEKNIKFEEFVKTSASTINNSFETAINQLTQEGPANNVAIDHLKSARDECLSQLSEDSLIHTMEQSIEGANSKLNDAILDNMQNTQNYNLCKGAVIGGFTVAAMAVSCGMAAAVVPTLVHSSNAAIHTLSTTLRSVISSNVKLTSSEYAGASSSEKDITKMNTFELIQHQMIKLKECAYPDSEVDIAGDPSPTPSIDEINIAQIKESKAQAVINSMDADANFQPAVDSKKIIRNKRYKATKTYTQEFPDIKQARRRAVKNKVIAHLDKLDQSGNVHNQAKASELREFMTMMETIIDAKHNVSTTGLNVQPDRLGSFWDQVLTCDDKVTNETYFSEKYLT